MDLLEEAFLLSWGYEKYCTKYSVMDDEAIENFKERIKRRPHKKQIEDIQHLRITSSETVFYIKYKEERMDLNQINEQLKALQEQLNAMQQSISDMLLTGNKPVSEPENYYVLNSTGIAGTTYSIDELQVLEVAPYNTYPTESLAKLAELERRIKHILECYAREVNKDRKVDLYDENQEKYIIAIQYRQSIDEGEDPLYITYMEFRPDTIYFEVPIFLEMNNNIFMNCRRGIEPLVKEYFRIRTFMGLF